MSYSWYLSPLSHFDLFESRPRMFILAKDEIEEYRMKNLQLSSRNFIRISLPDQSRLHQDGGRNSNSRIQRSTGNSNNNMKETLMANAMDIDNSNEEQRFLIVGSKQSSVFLFDLENRPSGSEPKDNNQIKNASISQFNYASSATASSSMYNQEQQAGGYQNESNRENPSLSLKSSVSSLSWFGNDNGIFASSLLSGYVSLWDTERFTQVSRENLGYSVYSIRFGRPYFSTSTMIACATGNGVRIGDIQTGSYSHHLVGHDGKVLACEWSQKNEFQLISGGFDKTIRVWDLRKSGKSACVSVLGMYSTSSSADRNLSHNGAINSLEFACNGRILISSGCDNKIRSWEDVEASQNALQGKKEKGSMFVHTDTHYHHARNNQIGRNVRMAVTEFSGNRGDMSKVTLFHPQAFEAPEGKSGNQELDNTNEIVSYELFTGKPRLERPLKGHLSFAHSCIFRECSKELLSIGNDGQILVWDAPIGFQGKSKEIPGETSNKKQKLVNKNEDAWSDDDDEDGNAFDR